MPYLREDNDGNTSVEFGPLITLGISTSFGLFLQAFKDGKAVYDPGDKATLMDGKWTPHARSQFRINLNDIAAIYGKVREVDMRDPNRIRIKMINFASPIYGDAENEAVNLISRTIRSHERPVSYGCHSKSL